MPAISCRMASNIARATYESLARLGRGFLALGAAAERQVSFRAKTDTSSQNRRRNTVDRKMHLAIPRRMTFVLLSCKEPIANNTLIGGEGGRWRRLQSAVL